MMGRAFDDEWDESRNPQLRVMRIIVAGMVSGATFFLAIAVFLVQTGGNEAQPPPQDSHFLLYAGLGFACAALVARMVIPGRVDASGRQRIATEIIAQDDKTARRDKMDGKLLFLFQTRLIVSAALLEAPTFFLLVVYLQSHWPVALFASIALIVLLAAHIPTRQRVASWMAAQRRAIAGEQAFGGQ